MSQTDGGVQAGKILGRYELLLPIAAGGMAMVWAARLKGTRGFQKIVAVKTMLPKLSEDPQFEQMFLDEASLASQIRHPNAVEILDLGEQEGILYLVMEWIEGVPLNQLMKAAKKQGGIPAKVAVRIAMQTCAGLHAAHELKNDKGELVGLVHRDVSPQNLLVTYDGVTKVVDFGVAKATALGDGATQAGQIKGKVGYMAPEQVKGDPIDRRVDVFALGIVLYALTTGKHPFRRESEAATMYNICAPQPVMPPRKVVADYPEELEAVILKALAKDKDKRFASANEMLRALDSLPGELRATTDHDVGTFVQGLLGSRREERKKALAEALERANQVQAESGTRQAMHATVQEPVSTITSANGQGSVSASGLTSGELEANPFSSNRRTVAAIGVAGVLLVLSGLAAYLLSDSGSQPAPEATQPQKAAAQGDSTPKVKKAPKSDVSATAVDMEDLPVAEPEKPEDEKPDEKADRDKTDEAPTDKASTRPTLRLPQRPAPKTPKPKPKGEGNSWDKQNPGF